MDVQNINEKKNHEYGLLFIVMPIGFQLHILLLTCNDQRSKIHQKIRGKKRDMIYDILNIENIEATLHFMLRMFGFIDPFMNLQN